MLTQPLAREVSQAPLCSIKIEAIKYLVADGRYKYIETGSLLSIKRNTKDILIPSEEHKISMYPMDYEEFLWAIGDEITADTIKILLKNKKPAGNVMHRNLMWIFRLYMLIGGMPQAIEAYVEQNNLQVVDEVKREIVDLYEEDFTKIDGTGLAGDIFDAIPSNLSNNASRYVLSNAREGIQSKQVSELVPEMLSSYTGVHGAVLIIATCYIDGIIIEKLKKCNNSFQSELLHFFNIIIYFYF